MTPSLPPSSFHFTLHTPSTAKKFGPRLGTLVLRDLKIDTPGLITSTSRGVVPHLSRDHVRTTRAIRWVHVPFETFLEHSPPVPTLQPGPHALHTFLGYLPGQHLLSLSLRDPADDREMPANGNAHVCASSLRGVRRISPAEWRTHASAVQPDIVVALTDTPFTHPPYSQKRLTKSIERSTAWLADILQSSPPRSSIFVHMAGQTNLPARRAFAESLTERLHGKDADAISPLRWLDEGVAGYTFDLVPLRASLNAASASSPNAPPLSSTTPALSSTTPSPSPSPTPPSQTQQTQQTPHLTSLLLTSLLPLPLTKPRLVHSTTSPHEVLALIRDVGIDVFDAGWAQRAADVGIALDFVFPVPPASLGLGGGDGVGDGDLDSGSSEVVGDGVDTDTDTVNPKPELKPKKRNGKLDIGHNLYSSSYAFDFGALAGSFVGAYDASSSASTSTLNGRSGKGKPTCPCLACSPTHPTSHILHSTLDADSFPSPSSPISTPPSSSSPNSSPNNNNEEPEPQHNINEEKQHKYKPPNTRAYIHHLLHTHEMSAHALLAMHNLAVVDAFFEGVRGVLGRGGSSTAYSSLELESGDEGSSLGSSLASESKGDEGVNGVGDAARLMNEELVGVDRDGNTEDTGLRLALSPTGHVILAGRPKPGFSDDDDGANSNDEMDPSQSQSQSLSRFETEINNFIATYAEPTALFGEATASWREVEMARGKGRLAREREGVKGGEGEGKGKGNGEGEEKGKGKGRGCEW